MSYYHFLKMWIEYSDQEYPEFNLLMGPWDCAVKSFNFALNSIVTLNIANDERNSLSNYFIQCLFIDLNIPLTNLLLLV